MPEPYLDQVQRDTLRHEFAVFIASRQGDRWADLLDEQKLSYLVLADDSLSFLIRRLRLQREMMAPDGPCRQFTPEFKRALGRR